MHPNEQQQYISIVPIQGGGSQVQGVPPGAYAYWQPNNGQPAGDGMAQTLTIVNAHGPGGIPLAMGRINPGMEPEPQQPATSHSGRGKEKGGSKSRRGGGAPNVRRGAVDPKHQPHSVGSPLLEEFRAKKNRDWTVFEIKGE
jgi:hypothetical protein